MEAFGRSRDPQGRRLSRFENSRLRPYTYLAEPSTGDKTDLIELEEPRLINVSLRFSEAALTEFVDAVSGKAKP